MLMVGQIDYSQCLWLSVVRSDRGKVVSDAMVGDRQVGHSDPRFRHAKMELHCAESN